MVTLSSPSTPSPSPQSGCAGEQRGGGKWSLAEDSHSCTGTGGRGVPSARVTTHKCQPERAEEGLESLSSSSTRLAPASPDPAVGYGDNQDPWATFAPIKCHSAAPLLASHTPRGLEHLGRSEGLGYLSGSGCSVCQRGGARRGVRGSPDAPANGLENERCQAVETPQPRQQRSVCRSARAEPCSLPRWEEGHGNPTCGDWKLLTLLI